MVQDAEKYKDEDEKLRKQVDASNALENFCYRVKNTLSEERLRDKFSDEDKREVEELVKEGLQYLESNKEASADELEAKLKELEAKFSPIMARIYQDMGSQSNMSGEMPNDTPAANADDLD